MSSWALPSREVTSDDLDIDDVGGYRLSVFHGENGDWYITILKPNERLGPWVRLAMSGGASSKHPGLGKAVKDLYDALVVVCNACSGWGYHDDGNRKTCTTCDGTGEIKG